MIFCELLKIIGIGVCMVFVVLFGMSVQEFVQVVMMQDVVCFMCLFGIGKKIVECLLFELKGKFGVDFGVFVGVVLLFDYVIDIFNVLLVFGYFEKEGFVVIKNVLVGIGVFEGIKFVLKVLLKV